MHRSCWARTSIPVAVLAVALASPHAAFATFTNPASVAQASISSATLQAPTSLAGVGGCQLIIIGPKVNLTWTATTSTFATGYDVLRSTTNGGPYSLVATVSGRTTVTFTDTSVSGGTTYYYVLRAKDLNWRSGNSNQASATTPGLCL